MEQYAITYNEQQDTNEESTHITNNEENQDLNSNQNNTTSTSTRKNFNPDDYLIMMQIGTGNFSEVYMVEHKDTKYLYTMKLFYKQRVEQLNRQEDVLMEKHVMEKIDEHENVIKYYGSFRDDHMLYILYEYVNGGELWKKSTVYGIPSEKLIKYYFLQVLDGIKHMHSFRIIHRDIKPENIMVTKDETTVKMIDFGSCKDLDGTEFEKKFDAEREKQKRKKPTYKNFVGTPNYMAPECVRNKFSDERCDMWSLGCLLFQLFTGFPPFNGKSDYLIFIKSTEAKFSFPEGIIPTLAQDLISKLIIVDPDKRLKIGEIYDHDFLKNENLEKKKTFPIPDLKDKAYKVFVDSLKKLFAKYKPISATIEKINEKEKLDEEAKRNEIQSDPDVEKKIPQEEKEKLIKEYDEGLNLLINKINETKELMQKEISNENDNYKTKILNRLSFLEIQLKHDMFNISFE